MLTSDNSPESKVDLMTKICRQAASVLADEDWHTLSPNMRELATLLTRGEYLLPSLKGGLVGKANYTVNTTPMVSMDPDYGKRGD